MKITFLGTGAATAYPLPFCRCENCEEARSSGGKSLRARSSLLINNDLIIDFGPDIMTTSFVHRCSISNVRYCLLTHAHSDHFDISHLFSRHPEYAPVNVPHLHFYASAAALRRAAELAQDELSGARLLDPDYCKELNLQIHAVETMMAFSAGGYRVTAFPANHGFTGASLLYAVERDSRVVFYGADTAKLSEETWQGFHSLKQKFDVVILDHTYGFGISRSDHLDALTFIEHITRMREESLLTERARVFATHISHEGNPIHPKLADFAAKHGYEVAYDGLTLEV